MRYTSGTPTENQEAEDVFNQLKSVGLYALYSGGRRHKGHGFWIKGVKNHSGNNSTWWEMSECQQLIENHSHIA